MSEYNDIYSGLLGNRVALRVLKCLCFTGAEMTGREIAASVDRSPQAALDVLNAMEDLALIESRRVGRARLYQANKAHWFIAEALIPLWERIDGWQEKLGAYYARRLRPKPIAIILFGSFARGEGHLESDLDLLFVFRDDQMDPDLLDRVLALNSDVRAYAGLHPSPKVISVGELKESIKQKRGFMRNIFIEGKSIYGLTPSEVLSYDRKED